MRPHVGAGARFRTATLRLRKRLGQRDERVERHIRTLRDVFRCERLDCLPELVELCHVPRDELLVLPAAFEDQADHARDNRRILARQRLQQLVREMGGLVAPRVDHQQLHTARQLRLEALYDPVRLQIRQ